MYRERVQGTPLNETSGQGEFLRERFGRERPAGLASHSGSRQDQGEHFREGCDALFLTLFEPRKTSW